MFTNFSCGNFSKKIGLFWTKSISWKDGRLEKLRRKLDNSIIITSKNWSNLCIDQSVLWLFSTVFLMTFFCVVCEPVNATTYKKHFHSTRPYDHGLITPTQVNLKRKQPKLTIHTSSEGLYISFLKRTISTGLVISTLNMHPAEIFP